MAERSIIKGICKRPEDTEWDVWGLLPKGRPDFKELMAVQLQRACHNELQPGYKDYLYAVAGLAAKDQLEVHIMLSGPLGVLPTAVALSFIPLPGSEFAHVGKPSITMTCKLEYARPCWGTVEDCVCETHVPYIMDCNNTALRWDHKLYALRLVKCYPTTRIPKNVVHVLGENEHILDQELNPYP